MSTIAVVSWASGPFVKFIDQWLASIRALSKPPDQIVLGTDTPMQLDGVDVLLCPKLPFSPTLFNAAVRATSTDWVCKLDVDDRLYPHAFEGIGSWHEDVKVFGVATGGGLWTPTGDGLLTQPVNRCTAASPFRRHVWEAGPFIDIPYWDWAFWIQAAKNGFTFSPTGRVDYEYVIHPEQITTRVDHDERVARVLAWRDAL